MCVIAAWLASAVIALTGAHSAPARHLATFRPATPRTYARRLTLRRWHSLREWYALDAIVRPESGWNPCAHYPSTSDCHYMGSNACGIPQRDPCPYRWRGRLWITRWAQVRELLRYVSSRYGDPLHALYVHESTGTY